MQILSRLQRYVPLSGIEITMLLFFVCSIFVLVLAPYDHHFVFLAKAFTDGKLYLGQIPGQNVIDGRLGDSALYHGLWFWPLGPVPALFYIPLMPLITHFRLWDIQSYSVPLFTLMNGFLLYSLGRKLRLTNMQSSWMMFAFMAASSYIGIAFYAINSFVSHAVTTLFVLWSLNEFYSKKRWWLIGLLMGLALGSRITAGIGILFFLASNFLDIGVVRNYQKKIADAIALMLPFLLCVGALAWYNYARFGNVLETGYRYQMLGPDLAALRDQGIFSISHVWANVRYFLFGIPHFVRDSSGKIIFPFVHTDWFGISIFLTSTYLLVLMKAAWKDRTNILLLATSVCISIPLFLLFSSGGWQYGYRFSLDFLPFLFVILMRSIALGTIQLGFNLKTVITLNALFNLYMIIFGAFLVWNA